MAAPNTVYAVTDLAHPAVRDVRPDCTDCLDLASEARSLARLTGAPVNSRRGDHKVTVTRVVALVDDHGVTVPDATTGKRR